MVARRAEHRDLATLTEDFWMFDEEVVAVMNYDAEHRPPGPSAPSRPVSENVAQRDLALSHATPIGRWMTENRDLLTE